MMKQQQRAFENGFMTGIGVACFVFLLLHLF